MRVRVDRDGEAVHLELSDAAVARRAEAADGVAVAYDADGRIVGVEVRGVAPAALHEFTVYLSSLADRPATSPPTRLAAAPAPASLAAPPPPAYAGPVAWDSEAEAAVGRMPFFQRGSIRLAAIRLARLRGRDRVTVDILNDAGR